ncbi:hypothetical protein M0657_005334 [Pyricularia oryzae]|uniref:DNA repair protein rad9 n=1 Tax=Pyricularia oryzae TaxID=318829 RepID=A0A4P7NAQ8_PYROR|nr:hypothetical protein M9X92_010690 [Pyricularia oryzae]KAI7923012.1 hypothetical protein M0657_005334 [Pyricularia oryzae]QBZ59659.1 hypothetical protein PoMZ_04622 [Pyricularia oryzae]
MAILNFTLSEDGVVALQNALTCLLRFCDDVSLDATKDRFILTGLNATKSAHISFIFNLNRFFSRYSFEGSAQYRDRFYCVLHCCRYFESVLVVIQAETGRKKQPLRDVMLPSMTDRAPRAGITATHSLPFEAKAPTRVKFDSAEAVNHWTMASRTLRQLMDHFGPGIDLLDIHTEGEGVVNFACYTEKDYKLSNDATILKKPLHTSIAVEMDEFDEIEVEDKLHTIIPVKDFRAILQHATTTAGDLSARYSNPGRPMKLYYSTDGILCEFILMTVGERSPAGPKTRKGRVTKTPKPGLDATSSRAASNSRAPTQQAQVPSQAREPKVIMPPPPARPSQFEMRPPPVPPPMSTMRSESMFVAQDDDPMWEPVNEEDENEEENGALGWDASNAPNPPTLRISDRPNLTAPSEPRREDSYDTGLPSEIEPTQLLSDVRRFGLFS